MNNNLITGKRELQQLISNGNVNQAESLCKELLSEHRNDINLYITLLQLQLASNNLNGANNTRALINDNVIITLDTHKLISNLFINNSRLDIAINQYYIAITQHPSEETLYTVTAGLLIHTRHYSEAIDLLESGLDKVPPSSQIHLMLGAAHQSTQNLEQALNNYKISFELSNENLDAATGLANIHYLKREYQEAAEIIAPIIENIPNYPVSAAILYSQLASAINQQDRAIKIVSETLLNRDMTDRQRSMLHFSSGRLHDESHDYQEAFKQYDKANALEHQKYDRRHTEEFFKSIKKIFNTGVINKHKNDATIGNRHIFIVGMPRSGTSLAEQILSSHPDVYGAGELNTLNHIVKTFPAQHKINSVFPEFVRDLDATFFDEIASSYQKHIDSLDNRHTFVTDKMPDNFLYLGLINIIFPEATIVHCTRNPYDTCLSCYFQQFSGHYPYAYQLDNLAHYYNAYKDLMMHWQKNLNTPIFEINYEALIEDKESVVRKLLEHCKLDWHKDCLEFNKSSRAVATASTQQVGKELYRTSIDRWRNYEPQLMSLISGIKQ